MSLTIERSAVHNTFVIERNYPVTPERVFAAFADPAKKRRWFADSAAHQVEKFEMDFRVGGAERSRYSYQEGSPIPGGIITSDGWYLDIVPNGRIVLAHTMAFGDQPFSASMVTFEFVPAEHGTDLKLTHQVAFFEGADGPQMREAGWRSLLERLATELAR
jgi:uncharacterized protein YndB with AHSA1/START domain